MKFGKVAVLATGFVVLTTVTATAGADASESSPSATVPAESGTVAETDLLSGTVPKDMVLQFGQEHGLTADEAQRVFNDSIPIARFLERHQSDQRFGAFWVTYERGYEVHVRFLDESFLPEIRELSQELDRQVTPHTGGASAQQLAMAEDRLKAERRPYEPDLATGTLHVFAETPGELKMTDGIDITTYAGVVVKAGAAPQYETQDSSRAGSDVWVRNSATASWYTACTAGAMWASTTLSGFIWAAHCPDLIPPRVAWVDGAITNGAAGSWSTIYTACGSAGDYEYVKFNVRANEAETFVDKRYVPAVSTPFKVAGGYYVGQPSFKVGLTSNGTTGTNMGSVAAYATSEVGVACEAVRPHLRYWHSDAGGDSGGPVFLFYGNEWYLGAIHNGFDTSFGGFRYGSAIWDVVRPTGTHICSQENVCT